MFPEMYELPQNGAELLQTINVKGANGPHVFQVLFSHRLTNIKAGDVMNLLSSFQVTNPNSFNAMIARHCILSLTPAGVVGPEQVSEAQASNISPAEHHKVFPICAWHTFQQDYDEVWVNVIIRSAHTQANGTQIVNIDPGYGWCDIALFRKPVLPQSCQ